MPNFLSRFPVERLNTVIRGNRVHNAVNDERRFLQTKSDVARLRDPRNLQILHVCCGDLLEGAEARPV